jgi:hypothetical protein
MQKTFFKIPFTRACHWAYMNVQTPLISVYRPCIKTGTHNQNTKGELVLLVLKWVSCECRLQICAIVCGNCHSILYVSNCDVAIYMTSFFCENDAYLKLD